MPAFRSLLRLLSVLGFVILAACATVPPGGPAPATPEQVAQLARAITDMGDGIDPQEAAEAAAIAYDYPLELRAAYQVTDPPLIHNMKVNNGTRPRGLCWQWADDMQARLAQENFQTLSLHRAIANADNPILIDHSTVIIAGRDGGHFDGIVLDPWRHSGALFWSPTLEDKRYTWVPRQEVFARKQGNVARAAN